MKLHILSDIHLEFEEFQIPSVESDVLILAGDIGVGKRAIKWIQEQDVRQPVLYVLGNHEFYGGAMPKMVDDIRKTAEGTNVRILEKDKAIIGRTTFLGCTLWTDFKLFGNSALAEFDAQNRMNDYRRIRVSPSFRKLRPFDTSILHESSLVWLKNELASCASERTVVITHHAPSLRSIPDQYKTDGLSPAYASKLDDFIESSKIDLWIHGHMHTSSDYEIGGTRVVCNSRGYPHERNKVFDPALIVEI